MASSEEESQQQAGGSLSDHSPFLVGCWFMYMLRLVLVCGALSTFAFLSVMSWLLGWMACAVLRKKRRKRKAPSPLGIFPGRLEGL